MDIIAEMLTPRSDTEQYLQRHPYFRGSDFIAHYVSKGHSASAARKALEYAVAKNRAAHLARGVYFTLAADFSPFVVASKLTTDAVITHHSALAFYELARISDRCILSSARNRPSLWFSEVQYEIVQNALKGPHAFDRTVVHRYEGEDVRVASLGRTLVDCLHRPELSFDKLGHLFEAFVEKPDLEIDLVEAADHVVALGNQTVAARFITFLWGHPRWRHRDEPKRRMGWMLPRQTVHADPKRSNGGKYIGLYRIIIPEDLAAVFARYP